MLRIMTISPNGPLSPICTFVGQCVDTKEEFDLIMNSHIHGKLEVLVALNLTIGLHGNIATQNPTDHHQKFTVADVSWDHPIKNENTTILAKEEKA